MPEIKYLNDFMDLILGFSILGITEVLFVACILYFIYTKTRASIVFSSLLSNVQLLSTDGCSTWFLKEDNGILSFLRTNSSSTVQTKDFNEYQSNSTTQNILLCTPHAGRKQHGSYDWIGIYFQHIAQVIRNQKFEYPQVVDTVLKDNGLVSVIKQAAEEENRASKINNGKCVVEGDVAIGSETNLYNENVKNQEKRAYSLLLNMRSTINHYLIAFTTWILYKLLPCFLSGIITHTKQIEMLKSATDQTPGVPLIFLPLHRSHLDYIMVTFILTNNDIRSPLVAAGNNLQIKVFGHLLRGLGAFFIKRKIDPVTGKKDTLYRALLQLYIQHALKMGHNLEFFLEGGRTRSGKPCLPKNGILSVIVNAFMDGSIPDALLVPVSINYEKLVDGNFVNEQMGKSKKPESFKQAIRGIWKTLNSNFGLIRIDFNKPYSIKELILTYNQLSKINEESKAGKSYPRQLQHNQSTSSLYGTDIVCEEHRTLIDSISRQIVYDCASATSVMTTNALSFLLLTEFRLGGWEEDIAKSLDELRTELKGHRDLGFHGVSLDIVRYATDLLGTDLVKRYKKENKYFIEPKRNVESLMELSYYSNTLSPHYILESLTLVILYFKTNKRENFGITRAQLIEATMEQCELLRYEFILNKPTKTLENMISRCIDNLSTKNLLILDKNENDSSLVTNRRKYEFLDIDDPELDGGSSDFEKPDIYVNIDNKRKQNSLMSILGPISYSYLTVAKTLTILRHTSMLESDFIKILLHNIHEEYLNETCPYGESVSTDYIKNCLKLMEKWGVINIYSKHGLRLLSLESSYDSSTTELRNIVSKISSLTPPLLQ